MCSNQSACTHGRVSLVSQQILVDQGERAEHVYFLESGVVSIVDILPTHSSIQIAVVGREGAAGCESLLIEGGLSPATYRVQLPGEAIRIPSAELKQMLQHYPTLEEPCMRSVLSLMRQLMLNAASNARDSLLRRLVRSLLLMHDRMDGDDVPITHEEWAKLLGVRRSGITVVASQLEAGGLLRINRGRMTILDRPGLEREVLRSSRAQPELDRMTHQFIC